MRARMLVVILRTGAIGYIVGRADIQLPRVRRPFLAAESSAATPTRGAAGTGPPPAEASTEAAGDRTADERRIVGGLPPRFGLRRAHRQPPGGPGRGGGPGQQAGSRSAVRAPSGRCAGVALTFLSRPLTPSRIVPHDTNTQCVRGIIELHDGRGGRWGRARRRRASDEGDRGSPTAWPAASEGQTGRPDHGPPPTRRPRWILHGDGDRGRPVGS